MTSKNGETKAQANRRIRQEALREQLSKQKHLEQVVDTIEKINKLGGLDIKDYKDTETYIAEQSAAKDKAQILKISMDGRLKLINKYLPDLKSVEVVDEDGNDALPKAITINVVKP